MMNDKRLALALLDWHNGQSCPVYSVGSRMLAISKGVKAQPITREQLEDAARCLRSDADQEGAHMRLQRASELDGLAREVQWLADQCQDNTLR